MEGSNAMPKRLTPLFLAVLLILTCGCSSNSPPAQFLPRPEISITCGHSYRAGDGWLGERIKVTGQSVKVAANSIFIDVVFADEINPPDEKQQIKLIGYDAWQIEPDKSSLNTLRLIARDIEPDRTYQLYIAKDIASADGKTLESDINIEILVEEEPKAFYKYSGQQTTIDNLGEMTSDMGSLHDTLPVSNRAIQFEANFTKKVDQGSVEKSIRKGLNGLDDKIDLRWRDEQNLNILLTDLPVNQEYLISMEEATDLSGNKVVGGLFFTALEPTEISSLDINTRNVEVLKQFSDMPYMLLPGDSFTDYFIVADNKNTFVLDTENKTMVQMADLQYAFGFPQYEWYTNWLDSSTVLLFDRENHTLSSRDFKNNQIKEMFTIPPGLIQNKVYDIKLSPEKDRIAVTVSGADMDLYVFSLDGDIIFRGEGIANTYTRNNGTQSIYLQWLNNHTFIFQENQDILQLDIVSGKKEVLLKDATEPVVYPNSNLMAAKRHVDRKDTWFLLAGAEKTTLGFGIDNLFFLSENKMVFNEGESMVLFDINLAAKEVIGKGHIGGISSDSSKIYFVNNNYAERRYYY